MLDALNEFLNFLRIEKNASPNTINSYSTDLQKYIHFLQTENVTQLRNITTSNIFSYIIYLQTEFGAASTTISRNLSSIRMFHQFLVREEYVSQNPAVNIEFPKLRKYLPTSLNQNEIEQILVLPDLNQPKGIRDKALLEFLYATGLRVSEIINIKLTSLFFNDGYIRVLGKGNKERIVPIGNQAVYFTEEYLKRVRPIIFKVGKSGDVVFLNLRGNKLSRMGLWKILREYITQTDIKKSVSPHTFRHFHYTNIHTFG